MTHASVGISLSIPALQFGHVSIERAIVSMEYNLELLNEHVN